MTVPNRLSPPRPPRSGSATGGSPAVVLTVVAGLVGLLLSLNREAFAIALFLGAVALAALPLALADKPGARAVRLALLGAAMGALAVVLALVPLLVGDDERAARENSPARQVSDVPSTPRAVAPTPAPTS